MCRWDSTEQFFECPDCREAIKEDGSCPATCGVAPVDPKED